MRSGPTPTNELVLQTVHLGYPFILLTDASGNGIGPVLSQVTLEGERPVHYISHPLMPLERSYAAIEKEALAVN